MCVAGFIYQVPCNLDGVNVFVCVCYIYKYNNEVWQIRDIYLFYMLLQAINDFQKVVRTQSTSKSKSKDHTSSDDIMVSVDMVPASIEVHRIFLSNKIKHKTVIAPFLLCVLHIFWYQEQHNAIGVCFHHIRRHILHYWSFWNWDNSLQEFYWLSGTLLV